MILSLLVCSSLYTYSADIGTTDSYIFGLNTSAMGNSSFAIGNDLLANSYKEIVVGTFNDTSIYQGMSATTWQITDTIFVVGNGTSSNARSNAFIVYKNGDIIIPKAQGDVSMGRYGRPDTSE